MALLYKDKEDVKISVKVTEKDGSINLLFTSDCGKHGMDEIIDEYDLNPEQLFNMLSWVDDFMNK